MSSLEVRVDPKSYGFSPERLALMKGAFDAYVEDRRLPGWLATISRGGQLIWRDKGGYRDREKDLLVTDDTIWRLYSMTKPITAVAVMMLYEEGHFKLDDDVGQWLDSFKELRVFSGGSVDAPETIPAQPLRVQHLLTHTSGLTYGFQNRHPVDALYRAKGYDFSVAKGVDLAQAVEDWGSFPLLFQPGASFNYSVAFDVLGRLIEIWSGQRLDVFMKERIFDPLGMHDTEWWCSPDKADRMAMLYVPYQGDSFPLHELAEHSFHPPRFLGGGGGLVSTAHDYERFMKMLLHGGQHDGVRLLSSRAVELMTENHLTKDGDLSEVAIDTYRDDEYAGQGFGFGVSVITDRRRNKSPAREGSYYWNGAASTAWWVDPIEDLTVGFYTQLLPSGTYPIRRELLRYVYEALVD